MEISEKYSRLLPIVAAALFLMILTAGVFNRFFVNNSETAYWIWRASDLELADQSKHLLVYQGDIRKIDNTFVFHKQGIVPHKSCCKGTVTLLIRVYDLPSQQFFTQQIDYLVRHWKAAGVDISGVQIDHDSPASRLIEYSEFMKQLEAYYGKGAISITGLTTWLTDNMQDLKQLAGHVDYIAFQLYQEYEPLKNYKDFLQILDKHYDYNYRLGITRAPGFARLHLPRNRNFKGIIVFLNEAGAK
jgi:hypothetical protein